jgi:glycerol-3-phosphate dehydrogenase (NAD(P)+)
MTSSGFSEKPVGVIGAGSFGTVIANMLGDSRHVLLYTRDPQKAEQIRKERKIKGVALHEQISITTDLAEIANQCDLIFPILPSAVFRSTIREISPYLRPYHILIHGTKGLDVQLPAGESLDSMRYLDRTMVKTMSEVIQEESVVVRVGCLAGPNLSRELAERQPGATVIASPFQEVINTGKKLLRNDRFQVYENNDLVGVELAGVLKNIIAIAAGALSGLGYGENARGLLISRGAVEMVYLGRALGGNTKAFLGVAGIGDLVATCNSPSSRNFTVGYRLAKGEQLKDILEDSEEIAEGINTVRIAKKLAEFYNVRAMITETLYKVLFENLTVNDALSYLMRYPLNIDIDFLKE